MKIPTPAPAPPTANPLLEETLSEIVLKTPNGEPAGDAELSEIFMRAFILRRLELISRGYGSLILLGSRHSAQTLRLRADLARGGPFRNFRLLVQSPG